MTNITLGELQGDYSVAELFKEQGSSTLSINYCLINDAEIATFLNNEISVGMKSDNDDIIIFWVFDGGTIELITPFNARLYTNKSKLDTVEPKMVMELVERTTNELIATREITLPKGFMDEIVPAIEAQLEQDKTIGHDPKWDILDIPQLKGLIPKFHKVNQA